MSCHPRALPAASNSSRAAQLFSLLVLVVLTAALAAAPANAAETHVFEASVGKGELTNPGSLAINQETGDLYVVDRGTGNVLRYGPDGAPLAFSATGTNSVGPFGFKDVFASDGSGSSIAVDSSGGPNAGRLYVASEGLLKIYDSAGEAVSGEPIQYFGNACGVAVDDNGYLYIAGAFGSVTVFNPSGELVLEAPAPFGACRIDVDANGDVYLGSFYGYFTYRLTPSEFPPTSATTYETEEPETAPNYGLGVDRASGDLYVNGDGYVEQYGPASTDNAFVLRFGSYELDGGSNSVAVDSSGGANDGSVYASHPGEVVRFGPQATVPGATTLPATDVDSNAGAATMHGTVEPAGLPVTECFFEYGPTTAYGQTAPCAESPAEIGSGSPPVPVHADVAGLDPARYHFRLVAANGDGFLGGEDEVFSIAGAETLPASELTQTSARLRARIFASGVPSSYQFEYGTDTGYGSFAPAQPAYAGSGTSVVSRLIEGLQPGVTYHFRAVTINAEESVFGPDRTFTTPTADPPARVYEQVSPVEKNGVDVKTVSELGFRVAPDGEAIDYLSNGSFGDAPTSLFYTNYRADRTADGWFSTPIDIPQKNSGDLRFGGVIDQSEDLSHAFESSREALAPGAVAGRFNFYLRDNETGNLAFIYSRTECFLCPFEPNQRIPGSSDYGRVAFLDELALTPGAPDNGLNKLYEFTEGTLKMASLAPDGTPSPEQVNYPQLSSRSRIVSADGSRVFYALGVDTAGNGSTGLYMREGDDLPVPISESQRAGDPPGAKPALFQGASRDGSIVYFVSSELLTDDATPYVVSSGGDLGFLYRYEVETGDLTNITPITDPGDVNGPELESYPVTGVSSDGETVYFRARAKLSPDATKGSSNLFVWDSGELAVAASEDPSLALTKPVSLSPNARFAAYETYDEPTGYDNVNHVACPFDSGAHGFGDRCKVVMVYDKATDTFACASCDEGGPPAMDAQMGIGDESNPVTDSGQVFFNSYDRLVPGDINGKQDAYEWQAGEQRLISTGTATTDSRYFSASRDGKNVFFTTDQQLVGQDKDNLVDLYDARLGGGIPSQNPPAPAPPCSGEECQPSVAAPGLGATPGSMRQHPQRKAVKRCRHVRKQGARKGKRRASTSISKKKRCGKNAGKRSGK